MNTINAEEILIPLIKCRCRSFSRIFPAQTQSPIQTRSHLASIEDGEGVICTNVLCKLENTIKQLHICIQDAPYRVRSGIMSIVLFSANILLHMAKVHEIGTSRV